MAAGQEAEEAAEHPAPAREGAPGAEEGVAERLEAACSRQQSEREGERQQEQGKPRDESPRAERGDEEEDQREQAGDRHRRLQVVEQAAVGVLRLTGMADVEPRAPVAVQPLGASVRAQPGRVEVPDDRARLEAELVTGVGDPVGQIGVLGPGCTGPVELMLVKTTDLLECALSVEHVVAAEVGHRTGDCGVAGDDLLVDQPTEIGTGNGVPVAASDPHDGRIVERRDEVGERLRIGDAVGVQKPDPVAAGGPPSHVAGRSRADPGGRETAHPIARRAVANCRRSSRHRRTGSR